MTLGPMRPIPVVEQLRQATHDMDHSYLEKVTKTDAKGCTCQAKGYHYHESRVEMLSRN